jgi:hypothetical protein
MFAIILFLELACGISIHSLMIHEASLRRRAMDHALRVDVIKPANHGGSGYVF